MIPVFALDPPPEELKRLLLIMVKRQKFTCKDFDLSTALALINEYNWQDPHVNGDIRYAVLSIAEYDCTGFGSPKMLEQELYFALRCIHGRSSIELAYHHPFWSITKLRTRENPEGSK